MENSMPMLALRGKVVFPNTIIYFDVSRERSVQALEEAMEQEHLIFLSAQIDAQIEQPQEEDIYPVGTIAKIKQMIKLPQGLIRVLAEGVERAKIVSVQKEEPFFMVEVERFLPYSDDITPIEEKEAYERTIKDYLEKYAMENPKTNQNLFIQMLEIEDFEKLLDEIASNLPFHLEQKQAILSEEDLFKRAEMVLLLLNQDIDILKIRKELQKKIQASVDKNQKDYILREQLKVIREELGENNVVDDAAQMREQLSKLKVKKEIREKIEKEISRFQNTPQASSESGMMRTYIETLLELPWEKSSRDNRDLKKAIDILEHDHYGLKKPKERIIEFLAVRALTKKGDAPIICLAGPPGTGKTSIAKSIAKAVNKKYVRISLGGVRDEAEIRGHRKTYVGAMPGRIVEAIRQAGVKNPLILLDEIDKVSSDYKGDTAAALLEVLDGEQNVNFRDHYIEAPIDLSEVLFVATANDLSTVAKPLLDRMEIIEVSSYTANEKFHIGKEYLIEKQIEKNGLKHAQISFTDESIYYMIEHYTREAGVRGLERKIGEICRKVARLILEEKEESVVVTPEKTKEFLGTEIFVKEEEEHENQIGVVNGLAWTSVGGDTLTIEVNIMPGKGQFECTGSLGDVMKESARIGISYIRSVSDQYHIHPEFFEKNDIHIHVPEGAVPKDGPSAGITMVTAMLSAITKTPVRGDLAMTGEVTLRGRVLPIGGLKEKILAAKMQGMKEVIVPYENARNIADLEEEITSGLTITYVRHVSEVIEKAFCK